MPFIATYRKEYIEPELKRDDLWKVYEWDEKVCFHVIDSYCCFKCPILGKKVYIYTGWFRLRVI